MKSLSCLCLCILLLGCTRNTDVTEVQNSIRSSISDSEKHNPYSLEIMRHAVGDVTGTRFDDADSFSPSHFYVEFSPKTKEQYDAVRDCFMVTNFSADAIPAESFGSDYICSSAELGTPDVLYAKVPAMIDLPDSIEHRVLHSVYDPYCVVDDNLAGEIVDRAYEIAAADIAKTASVPVKWLPSGTVYVWDDMIKDMIPLEGVNIYLTTSNPGESTVCRTDENGYFRSDRFFYDAVTYSIPWQDEQWVEKVTAMNGDFIITTQTNKPWDVVIDKNKSAYTKLYYLATIHRAAYYYWYKAPELLGFTAPKFDRQLRIVCHDDNFSSEYDAVGLFWPSDRGVNLPDVEIWCKNQSTPGIIGISFHELGHAAHCSAVGYSYFWRVKNIIKESWATFTKWLLTDAFYAEYAKDLHTVYNWCDDYSCYRFIYPDYLNKQNWSFRTSTTIDLYSPLFIDIYDNFDQRFWFKTVRGFDKYDHYPNDRICIEDIQAMEAFAFGSIDVSDVKLKLMNYNHSYLQQDIDDLFSIFLQIESE